MRSDGNNCNYFPENQLTNLAHLLFMCSCLVWRIGGRRPLAPAPLATPLNANYFKFQYIDILLFHSNTF